eukprot:GEMP01054382.1.p1 GENE.GEMP01054382.1~~GEMP01054382.1.p1  ORF type:complete len:229 (+),score=43.80 GEMP01054382.1:242-928(+)
MHPDIAGENYSKKAFEELQKDYERCVQLLKGERGMGETPIRHRWRPVYKSGRPVDPRRYVGRQQYYTQYGGTIVYWTPNETFHNQWCRRAYPNYALLLRRATGVSVGIALGFAISLVPPYIPLTMEQLGRAAVAVRMTAIGIPHGSELPSWQLGESAVPQEESMTKLLPDGSAPKLPQVESTSKLSQEESTSKLPQEESTSKLPQEGPAPKLPRGESMTKLPQDGSAA